MGKSAPPIPTIMIILSRIRLGFTPAELSSETPNAGSNIRDSKKSVVNGTWSKVHCLQAAAHVSRDCPDVSSALDAQLAVSIAPPANDTPTAQKGAGVVSTSSNGCGQPAWKMQTRVNTDGNAACCDLGFSLKFQESQL
jgi:hypothetical protein